MITDTHIVDNLYSQVEASLKRPENVKRLVEYISRYIDKNSFIFFSTNFSERLIVGDADKEIVYTCVGVTEKEALAVIKKSKYIANVSWVSNPFTVLLVLAIRYFSKTKMLKEAEICNIYVTCLFYTLTHVRSFKYLPNKEIMDYTLNRNPKVTNSFIIKKEGTIFGLIKYTGMTSHEFYIKDLVGECTDIELNNYLSAIRTRIGSNMKNLATYYYEDHKSNNYLNKDSESFEEENYRMTDSTTLAISKLATKTTTNIISYRFSRDFIEQSAQMDINTSTSKLSQIMDNIIEYHRRDIDTFVSSIIELYVVDGGNNIREVGTIKFLTHSLNLYKTNSTKPKVIEIKDYLDKWIEDGSKKFGTQFVRAATLNAYRRCIFMVFVYSINQYAK